MNEISVMFVDDEKLSCEQISEILTGEGYKVCLGQDGQQGLDIFMKERPDIVITDIRMPVMNGLEMARRIRSVNPGVQIIVMTAISETEHMLEAIELGISRYILKPLNYEKLIESVAACSGRIRMERRFEQQTNDLGTLLKVSHEISSSTSLNKIYRVVIQSSMDMLKLDFSTVMLLTDDKTRLRISDTLGFPESMAGNFSLVEGQGLSTLVIKNGQPGIVDDFREEARFEVPEIVSQKGIISAICVPMMLEDEVFGVLIGHTLDRREFSGHDISLYQHIANQAAVAINNAVNLHALKESENRYRGSENKLRDITSHLGEGVYVLDKAGQLSFMNPEAERLLGWSEQEIMNKNAHDLLHYKKADGTPLLFEDCRMHNVIRTGEKYFSNDEVFIRKDGVSFPVSVISTPIVRDGEIVAAVTAFRDITTIKALEEEILKTRKLESISILAGGIAHDFNNILTGILGYISLSKILINPAEKAYSYLTEAENACDNARELSFRLLTFSKGGEPLKKVVSIVEILEDSIGHSLGGTNIRAELTAPDNLLNVEVDANQMKQVFNNLFLNAKEALPGGGKIGVAADNIIVSGAEGLPLKPGRYIKIAIEDSGEGIREEYLQKVFDPYFSTKEMGQNKGMGLGLAICHSVIRKHDGYINAESKPGKGSTFYIYLPAVPEEPGLAV